MAGLDFSLNLLPWLLSCLQREAQFKQEFERLKFILLYKQHFSDMSLSMYNFDTVRMTLQCIAGESISEIEKKKKNH